MQDEKERGITIDYNEKKLELTTEYFKSKQFNLNEIGQKDFTLTF